jgi:hypothetical protein
MLAGIFIMLNLVAMPFHVLTSAPAPYNAGVSEQEYEKVDFAAADWLNTYGRYKISSPDLQHRFWPVVGVDHYENQNNTGLYLDENQSNSYLMVTPQAEEHLDSGFRTDPDPPNYENVSNISKIYTTFSREIYISK